MRRTKVARMADGAPVGMFAARFCNPAPVTRPAAPPPVTARVYRVVLADSRWPVAGVIARDEQHAVDLAVEKNPKLAEHRAALKAEVA